MFEALTHVPLCSGVESGVRGQLGGAGGAQEEQQLPASARHLEAEAATQRQVDDILTHCAFI